ncbi:MAG: hypothetical protein H6900_09380 [Rhodobacter sp.]|uniref:hypothetical protein n=1 Tax=Pararhodobacter sp. TaxID=2127056 RepID=UPI001DE90778|nr:hypothetical protein [Pararhodobacter sp.]MCB1343792.1 hypothetical protein [Paracoccaceae bacterium]MCC0073487.1 hypothetical protein [Rhodobacter sp.]HPD92123.1 hypothetical protein [Pararhodobacter sp.]
MERSKIVEIELEFERMLAQSRELSVFRRNPTTWEFLLLLAQSEQGAMDGLYSTIDAVQTRYLGNSALLKFIRERRDHGDLRFLEADKKSKWIIQVDQKLIEHLETLLRWRDDELIAASARPNHEPATRFAAPPAKSES